MKIMDYIDKTLCGDKSPIGAFAELINYGTDKFVPVPEGAKEILIKCWCCTFWRGVLLGGVVGLVVGLIF